MLMRSVGDGPIAHTIGQRTFADVLGLMAYLWDARNFVTLNL